MIRGSPICGALGVDFGQKTHLDSGYFVEVFSRSIVVSLWKGSLVEDTLSVRFY